MNGRSFAVASLLALAGCVSFEPRPIIPAESAARFEQRSLDDSSLRSFVRSNLQSASIEDRPIPWNLDALTLAAFYFDGNLAVARAQWAVAKAARITAGEHPGLAASITPARNTTTTTPSPGLFTTTVDLTLETGGKRGYRLAEAAQLSEAARLNVASIAWQARARVQRSLLDLYGALESERLLSEQQSLHAENVKILEGQFRAGAISAFELTQARLAADRSQLALRDAERREAEARAMLAAAVGIPFEKLEDVQIRFDGFEESPAGISVAEARRQALQNRADILSALAQYAASQSRLQLAIAGQYPDIRLGPGYEYDQGDNKWSLGLSVSLPPDRNRGQIAEAQARREEAAARFAALQTMVLGQVDLAIAAYRAAAEKQADATTMLSDLTQQGGVAEAMFRAGAISGSELTALRLQSSVSALARLDALQQAKQAAARLDEAVQSPLGLPSAVWEQAPAASDPAGGANGP